VAHGSEVPSHPQGWAGRGGPAWLQLPGAGQGDKLGTPEGKWGALMSDSWLRGGF